MGRIGFFTRRIVDIAIPNPIIRAESFQNVSSCNNMVIYLSRRKYILISDKIVNKLLQPVDQISWPSKRLNTQNCKTKTPSTIICLLYPIG